MTLAERMIVMNAGRMEQIGTPDEVYHRPATTFVAGFIGSPPMNLLRGRSDGARFAVGDQSLALPEPAPRGGELILGIRPEHLALGGDGASQGWPMRVEALEMLGAERLVYGCVGGVLFTVAHRRDVAAAEGRRHDRGGSAAPSTCTGSTPPRSSACLPRPPWRHDGRALALSALDRAPRRRRLAPENTLAAFRVGAAHGFRAFECDVKLSADGVPFLLHDAMLERTTYGHGHAGDLDWSRAVAPRRRRVARPRVRRRAAAEPRRDRALLSSQRACAEHRDQAVARARRGDRPCGGARAASDLWRGAAASPLLSSFKPASLAAARAAVPRLAARAAARSPARRLARRSARARLRRRGDQLGADRRERAVGASSARAARARLHRERSRRGAAAHATRHRRHDHRCGRSLFTRPAPAWADCASSVARTCA